MEILKLTKDNFEAEVKNSDTPVLVDFWAVWCGPCQMQAPILDELAAEYPQLKIGKVNVDEEQKLAMTYGISSIPSLLYFENGKVVQQLVGVHNKVQLVQKLGL